MRLFWTSLQLHCLEASAPEVILSHLNLSVMSLILYMYSRKFFFSILFSSNCSLSTVAKVVVIWSSFEGI